MTPSQLLTLAIGPALTLLPPRMDSPDARRMLVAIAIQESTLRYRQQVLRIGRHWWEWRGPSRGWWQFESVGLRGVLTHRATRAYAREVMTALGYDSPPELMPAWLSELHGALKHNDVLAAAMARLLLWTLPQALPTTEVEGWGQYLQAWRPGRPHGGWPRSWGMAQEVIP